MIRTFVVNELKLMLDCFCFDLKLLLKKSISLYQLSRLHSFPKLINSIPILINSEKKLIAHMRTGKRTENDEKNNPKLSAWFSTLPS